MSKSIDERVVELQFNNAEFEKGVATTIETMEKLQKSLEIQDTASKSLKSIQSSVNNLDLNPIGNAVDSISSKFSNLSIIGVSALATLASQATVTATSLVNRLVNNTIGQIYSGGVARAQNIANAKFQLEGLGIAWESIEEDINYGVKDTAYGLDSAAKVASQLVASQVEVGDSMKTALRAVSGVAAMTNSTYDDIGSIFTTVAGNGRLMSDQLNQLASRGLNAASTLGKYLGKTEAEVRTMTSKGQIDFATFAAAMDDAFGEHAKDANKTFNGALSNMKAALSRIGADVASPALENLRDIFNALKDRINEAHTALAPFIAKINELQNKGTKLLVNFINGGSTANAWDSFVEKVNTAGMATEAFEEKLKEAARENGVAIDDMIEAEGSLSATFTRGWLTKDILTKVINDYADAADTASESTEDLNEKLEFFQKKVDEVWYGTWDNGQARIDKLTAAGYDYYSIQRLVNATVDKHRLTLDDLSEAELAQIGYTEDEIAAINELKAACEETGGSIDEMIESLSKKTIFQLMSDAISNIVISIQNIGKAITSGFTTAFSGFKGASNAVWSFADAFDNLTKRLYIGDEATENLTKAFTGIAYMLRLVAEVASKLTSGAFSILSHLFSSTETATYGLVGSFGDLLIKFYEWVHSSELIRSAIDTINWAFDKFLDKIDEAKAYIKESGIYEATKDVFGAIGEVILAAVSHLGTFIAKAKDVAATNVTWNRLVTALNSLKTAFKRLGSVLSGIFGTALKTVSTAMGNLWENIKAWVNSSGVQEWITSVGEGLANAISGAADKLSEFIGKFSDREFSNGVKSVGTLTSSFKEFSTGGVGNAISSVGNFISTMQSSFSSSINKAVELTEWFTSTYNKAQSVILDTVSETTLGSVMAAGLAGSMTWFIVTVGKSIKKVASGLSNLLNIGSALSGTFGQITKTFKALEHYIDAKKLNDRIATIGKVFLQFAISVGILVAAIVALTMVDQDRLGAAVGIVAGFAVGMVALIAGLAALDSKVFKGNQIEKYAAVMLSFAGSIAILCLSLESLAMVETDVLWSRVAILTVLIGVMVAAVVLMAAANKKIGKLAIDKTKTGETALTIVAFAASMFIIAKALTMIAELSTEQLSRAIPVLVLVAGIISVMAMLTSITPNKADVGTLALAASLGIMVNVLQKMAAIDTLTLIRSIPALIEIMGTMITLLIATKLAGEKALEAGGSLIFMAVAIGVMSKVLVMLAAIDIETVLAALPSMITCVGLISVLFLATKLAGENALKAGVAIFACSAALIIISAAIMMLSYLDDAALGRATAAVSGIMGMMAIVIASTEKFKEAHKTLYAIAIAIGVMAAAVAILSLIDPERLVIATAALDSLMVALAALLKSTGSIGKKVIGTIAVVVVVIGALAGLVTLLASIENIDNAISAAAALDLLMLGMAVLMKSVKTIKLKAVKEVVAMLGTLTTVVYALAGVLVVLSTIENPRGLIPTVVALDILLAGIAGVCVVAQYIKDARAALAGIGVISACISAITTLLGLMGGIVNAIPGGEEALETASRMMKYVGEAIGGFVGGIVESFGDAVLGLLDSLGTHLSNFWTNVQPFVDGINSIDPEFRSNIKTFANAIDMLINSMVTNQWANALNFIGPSSLVEFAKDIADFSEEMKNTQERLKELDYDVINQSLTMLGNLGKALSEFDFGGESGGGLASWWSGTIGDKLKSFAAGMGPLAAGLGAFGDTSVDVDADSVKNRAKALKALVNATKDIPETGGLQALFNGNINYTTFAGMMQYLGTGLSQFSENSAQVNLDNVNNGAEAVKLIATACDTIYKSEGLVQWFEGSIDPEKFGVAVGALGSSLWSFSGYCKQIDEDAVQKGVTAISALAAAQNDIDRVDGVMQQIEGTTSFETFAVGINAMNKALQSLSSGMAAVNTENLDTGINYINRYVGELMPAFEAANYESVGVAIQQFNATTDKLNNLTQLTTNVAEVTEALCNACAELLTSVASSKINTAYYEFGAGLIQRVADGIDRKRTTLTTMMDSIIATLNTYQSKFQTTGLFMMSGLSSGISQGRSKVINAAVQTATEAYKKAQAAVEVNSPSKKFKWLGQMCNLGWALGFSSTSDKVSDAAEDTGVQMLSALSTAMANVEAVAESDLSISPVITPVVDLSNIKTSRSMIDSLYSSMNSLSAQRNIGVISDYEKASRASRVEDVGNTDITNYYFDGINVNGTTEASMAEEIVNVLTKYKRLAAI